MTDLQVEPGALTGAAGHFDTAAERTAGVRREHGAADLPGGCLGKLPQSDEILAAFTESRDAVDTALGDLEDTFSGIADRLLDFRDHVVQLDQTVEGAFHRLQGGA